MILAKGAGYRYWVDFDGKVQGKRLTLLDGTKLTGDPDTIGYIADRRTGSEVAKYAKGTREDHWPRSLHKSEAAMLLKQMGYVSVGRHMLEYRHREG